MQIQRYPLAAPRADGDADADANAGDLELAKHTREELAIKLEAMGFDVGYRFAER